MVSTWFSRAKVPWLLAAASSWALGAHAQTVDLSTDWGEGALYNRNRAYCTIQAAMAPAWTRGYVVIQDGLLVAEGYTGENNQNGKYDAWSATKSWSTFFMGVLVDQGLVSTSDTLIDIFDDADDWVGVEAATDKQAITVLELLTMTSGLVSRSCSRQDDQSTLQAVLNHAVFDANQRGLFNYMGATHILAQIIFRRSGMTPREFAASAGIFSKLGMDDSNFDWNTFGGIEGSAFGLLTNPRIMAKLGQLYLQGGLAAVGDQLVSTSWVEESTVNQLPSGETNGFGTDFDGYGYQWYAAVNGGSGSFVGASAAVGAFGQIIVFLPASNTVIAIMGDGCMGLSQNFVFLQTIADNLDDLTVEQATCTQSFSYWNYASHHVGSLFWDGLQALPNALLGRHSV